MKHFSIFLTALIACTFSASAQNMKLTVDKPDGIYAKGDRVVVNCQSEVEIQDSLTVNIYSNNRQQGSYRIYLRLLRAIEYMTQQPEWDGKRILVIGESQGGGQAVAAAGLDSRVSAVVLNVPAMQDLGGTRVGRRAGWPQPIENHPGVKDEMLDACLPYFDGALLLRHSHAEIFCEMGLIDTTCPPSAVWASLNGAPGKKTIRCVPFRTHSWPSGQRYAEWNEGYYQPRLRFISDYLK